MQSYKVSYWYCGYQVKDEAKGVSLQDAFNIKQKLTQQNTKNFVHYEIHKEKK